MSTVGAPLAEVYVMKKMYKEKMKRKEKIEAGGKETHHVGISANKSKISSGGCFSGMFKKIHPNSSIPSSDSAVQS